MATRRLIVEIVEARNLLARSGSGNAFCTLNYDNVKRKTEPSPIDRGPTWGQEFDFRYFDLRNMEICVYSERKGRTWGDGFLGKVQFKELHVDRVVQEKWHRLEKRSVFSQKQGELLLKLWYEDKKPDQDDRKPNFLLDGEPSLERTPSLQQKQEPPPQHGGKPILQKGEKSTLELERKAASDREPKAPPLPPKISKETGSTASKGVPTSMVDMFNVKDIVKSNVGAAVHYQQSYDLVEPMPYLFVKVVRARNLTAKEAGGNGDPYVKISVGEVNATTQVIKQDLHPEWNRTFAFNKEKLHGQFVEISVWDASITEMPDVFLGALSYLLEEIPSRSPPESPLASLWYKLEERPGKTRVSGELMMALWMGTNADEAFQDAWQLDTGGHPNCASKVYLSPKLWYLRVQIIQAQDLAEPPDKRVPEPFVEIQLGLVQTKRVIVPTVKGVNPIWNKDCLFVAAEPFEELLIIIVKDRIGPNVDEIMGVTRISLGAVPRRLDFRRAMNSSWFTLESGEKGVYKGRIHLRLHFEGGYHASEEHTDFISCVRPTAKQLWKKPLGVLQLGILAAKNLLPMHNIAGGRGFTDAYCVAKYGHKWVRTRTISQNFEPTWNEQYSWEVYDPSTVLTVCVFDNRNANSWVSAKGKGVRDTPIGKVRLRLSTLDSGRAYFNSYPLLVVTASGLQKMGELELSVRFTCLSTVEVLKTYLQPPLPLLHYSIPINVSDAENLRIGAMNLVASRLARFHPPLRQEVVKFMLDSEDHRWSMRRSKANYFRMASLLSGFFAVHKSFDEICTWRHPGTTVSVHIFFLILVWFPWLLLPIVFFYMFLRGIWNYRFRPGSPPRLDPILSQGGEVGPDVDELEEEFNVVSDNKVELVLKARYERLRGFAGRIQHFIGDLASQGERLGDILNWRDPRATAIFVTFCLTAAVLLLVMPRVVAALAGVYLMRHPQFRGIRPAAPLNFFRRLPSRSDGIL